MDRPDDEWFEECLNRKRSDGKPFFSDRERLMLTKAANHLGYRDNLFRRVLSRLRKIYLGAGAR